MANIATTVSDDNENDAHTGSGDNDFYDWAYWPSGDRVEFNIPLDYAPGLVSSVALVLNVFDVDPAELDLVLLNGHQLTNLTTTNYLTPADNTAQDSVFVVDPAWLVQGNNLVEVYNVNTPPDPNSWWFEMRYGRLQFDLNSSGMPVVHGTIYDDLITTGSDNDTLIGHAGYDALRGGLGNDSYILDDISSYNDGTQYRYDDVGESPNEGIDTVVVTPVGSLTSYALTLHVENATVVGAGAFDLTGTGDVNVLRGNGDDNQLYGAGGDDELWGGDTANVTYGQDRLYGGANNDRLHAANGGEVLGGSAVIYGGEGDDIIYPNLGYDDLYGGNGNDLVDFSNMTTPVTVDLTITPTTPGTFAGLQSIIYNLEAVRFDGIENLVGGAAGDRFLGNDADNMFFGGGGGDDLDGRGGNDTLFGGDGADSLWGGEGTNFISGDAGNDTITSGDGVDTVYCGIGDDWVTPESYNGGDSYYGGGGVDTLDFSTYDSGTNSPITVIDLRQTTFKNGDYLGYDGTDTIAGFENVIGTDRNEGIIGNDADNLIFGASGDDFADGAGGNDVIYASVGDKQSYGSGGDDEIWDSVGNDTLDGGEGIDKLVFGALTPFGLFTATASITVDLGTTKGQNTGAGFEFIKGFENVVCGSGDDTVLGNSAANVLSGGAGNDRYSGFGGDDYLSGDEGADVLDGGKRNDHLDGGAGDDKLTGGAGDDTFILKSGKDKITDFSSAHDTLVIEGDGQFELTPGKIKSTNFEIGTRADDKNDYFIYSQTTGKLFFDADGNHSAAKTLIAVFVDHAALKFGDFLIH